MAIQDVDDLLWPAVRRTLNALELDKRDEGAATAAVMIAVNIDAHPDKIYAMRWLMPELLKYLIELGATPAARAAIKRGSGGGDKQDAATVSRLDQLRTSRAARRPAGA